MISIDELCKVPFHNLPLDHKLNLTHLHYCLNILRAVYGKPIYINSGYRTKEDQIRIYTSRNPLTMGLGLPIPMESLHLCGAAADLHDPDGMLKKWIFQQKDLYERLDLYFEDFDHTPTWLHVQIYPPKSLKRYFLP